jgi:hypothetical protein
MLDLRRALYSHCDHPLAAPPPIAAARDALVGAALGARFRPTRIKTFLQGTTTDLPDPFELRLHAWVDLPAAHPRFPDAARGLVCVVRPVAEEGLTGPTLAGVGWLERRLAADGPGVGGWVGDMLRADGHEPIDGAEWLAAVRDPLAGQVLAFYLARHLEGMVNHTLLEERLGVVLEPLGGAFAEDDDGEE